MLRKNKIAQWNLDIADRKKEVNTEFCIWLKYVFDEGKIKTYSDKRKQREFIVRSFVL